MASVRLTNEIREEITTAMLRHRFSKEVAKLVALRAKLADRVYRDLYSPADRKKMEALPDGWLPVDDDVQCRFQGSYQRLKFNGGIWGDLYFLIDKEVEVVNRRLAAKHKSSCAKVYDGGHPIAEAYAEVEGVTKDLTERFKDAKRQIKSALSRATTTTRLIELWPEVRPFCSDYEHAAPSLPAIQTSALNAMLDLPVSEAA